MPGTTPAASQLDWLIPSTGAILFEGDQRTAQVINLGHGGTSIGFRTTTTVPDLCRRPHSFWTHNGLWPPARETTWLTPFRTSAGSKSEADQCDCPTSSARIILRYRHANRSHG